MTEQKRAKKYRHYTYFRGSDKNFPFACFQCRKVFKRRVSASSGEIERPNCLRCGAELWFTGTAFRAPRQEDIKQWRKAEMLIRSGMVFSPNSGALPETLREAIPFLMSRRRRPDLSLLTAKQGKRARRQNS